MKNQTPNRQIKLKRVLSGLAFAGASLALATAAQAQTTSSTGSGSSMSMYSPGSAYIGLNAGRSNYSAPGGTGIFSNDKNGNAYSLYGGSYFSPNFGWELGYNDFGSINRGGGTTKANAFSLSLVGKAPLSSSFNLLGRIGGSYAHTDVSSAAGSGITPGTDNKFDLSYGVGAEFAFNPQLSAVLQYDSYNLRYAGGNRDRINTTTLGLRYRF
ncbi:MULTISPECIES: outer membrane beta-barrel protein [Polaromonas]|uniref:Outer membrane beta-barrel protein n=1 Tax=Polaromonas aquatica TaxID=332657 RepID=A0ABW1TTB4_9BURK